ncbi:MAG: cysteine desulfurase [Acidimicrobiia bacterium]|nr:cysteine desulfurase [Acidimicrobiia bacterium]NNC92926.1 cysteine desulfurase [Acidimicrobiia bacterium]RZV40982.1 MAG: cysteine desulfurase [Acidimicrobiia bacterium]
MLYLDHAATTPMRPEAWNAMESARDSFGNPSGVHAVSRTAKNALEEARERAAAALGAARPSEIVFTAGGTEADNLAVAGAALAGGTPSHVVVSAVEHKAVLESASFVERLGARVTRVTVDEDGLVDPNGVVAAVGEETAVVSVMLANNETGARQPVSDIATGVHSINPRTRVHTDAVQAFISEDVDVAELGVDLLSLAAHKFGGPKGIGLLYVRDGVRLEPAVHGGSQEMGRRAGTQNLMGATAMVAAMEATVADRQGFRERVAAARDAFELHLAQAVPGLKVNGPPDRRLVQHSHLGFPGHTSETLLIRFDQSGLAAAAGSACQSGAVEASHVLAAMGMSPTEAAEAIRFSFGWTTVPADAELAAKIVLDVLEDLA